MDDESETCIAKLSKSLSFYIIYLLYIVSDTLIIPLGFDSSFGHKIYNCDSPLMRSMDSLSAIAILKVYVCLCVCIYTYICKYI